MQRTNLDELRKMENPNPGTAMFAKEVIHGIDCGAASGVLSPHQEIQHHYHAKHESIFFVLSGEVTVLVEGKEYLLKENDVMYIAPGEKHKTMNKSDKYYHYLEFHIPAPDRSDAVLVKD